jgi:hypothetical protein
MWGGLNLYISISLEGWSVVQVYLQAAINNWIWIWFTPWIFLGSYVLINLFLAALTSKLTEASLDQQRIEREKLKIEDN